MYGFRNGAFRIGIGKRAQETVIATLYILLASAFTMRLVLYPASQLLPILGLALAAVFIIWRPVLGTALYMLVYPSVPQSGSINMMKFAMLLLTVFLFSIWLWRKLRARDHVWNLPHYRWLFLFCLYLCFSPFLGPSNGFTVLDWARDIAPLLNLLLIPMLTEQFGDKKNLWLAYFLFIPVLIALARDFINLASHYLPIPWNPLNYLPYQLSTFHIGVLLCAGVILYLHKIKPRFLWPAIALMALGCTAITITRTIWISVVFTIGLATFFYSRFRKASIVLIAASVVGVAWFYFAPAEQRVSLKSNTSGGTWWSTQVERVYGARHKDVAIMNRNVEFSQAKDLFVDSPFFGKGFGYIYHFWRYHVSGLGGSGFFDSNYTHNDIINFLAKGGLVGFGLWLIMLLKLVSKLLERRKTGKGTPYSLLPTLAIITILNAVFVGSSTPVFQNREAMFFLVLMVALGLSIFELRTNGDESWQGKQLSA